jgi:polysaccharide biosynthesis transport protein
LNSLTTRSPNADVGTLPYRDVPYYPEPVATGSGYGLSDLIRLVQRNRLLILAVVVPATLATLAWQLLSPTLYSTAVSVKVELIDNIGDNQADILARNNQRVANEVKLYRSNASAERVVRDLGLHRDQAFAKEMGGKPDGGESKQVRSAALALAGMTAVEADEGSDQIEVRVTTRSPELAAKIANQIPESVAALRIESTMQRRRELLASLDQRRLNGETEANDAARQLADFRIRNRILVGGGGVEDLQQVNRIAIEAASARGMQAAAAAQSAGVARAAGIRSVSAASSPLVQQLRQQEATVAAELARMSQTHGAMHPDIQRLNGQLGELRSSLAREESSAVAAASAAAGAEGARMAQMARSEASGASARAGQLSGILAYTTQQAFQNANNSVELERLVRNADQAAKSVQTITERIAQVRATTEQEGVTSDIISPAVVNYQPVGPLPLKFTTMALLGSGLLGLMLAFTRELVDNKLRTVAQVRRLFSLPTLGMLPLLEHGVSSDLKESPVVQDPQSLFAEVARATYSEVLALNSNGGPQTVLITSPLPSEGKSVVALSLAVAAVAMGKRAIVVDLDLRKAGIIQQIQQRLDTPDLLDLLKGTVDLKQIAASGAQLSPEPDFDGAVVDMSRMALLSVSKPVARPAAVIGSQRLEQLLDNLRSKFDLIVLNAPPTLAVRDAVSMADLADHTLLVARWGRTTTDQMRAALELLDPERVDGVIYSHVDYAEHARRVYGDSIQYYFESSDYYGGSKPQRITLLDELKNLVRRRAAA